MARVIFEQAQQDDSQLAALEHAPPRAAAAAALATALEFAAVAVAVAVPTSVAQKPAPVVVAASVPTVMMSMAEVMYLSFVSHSTQIYL
ncbi:MAG TPA: hypothetical protein VEQ58_05415 [Polyangiaceae bacterium]|nr:hypothetical protein [Polyangiaceae bacterium]